MCKLLFILIAAAFILAGCAETGETDYSALSLDAGTAAETISSGLVFDDTLARISDERASQLYPFGAESLAAYAGSGATAEVVIVAQYSDPAAATAALTMYDSYLSDQKTLFTDYNASELPKLESAVCETKGCYVFCIVNSDATAAQNLIDETVSSAMK